MRRSISTRGRTTFRASSALSGMPTGLVSLAVTTLAICSGVGGLRRPAGSGSAAWRSSGAGGRGRGARGVGRALHRAAFPATVVGAMTDEPAARAVALVERLFALLHDCRALVPQLEAAGTDPESVSAQAERLLYFALVGAIEAGLVRAAEDA